MRPNGIVVWAGPSRLTGAPIVAVVTGLGHFKSHNPKTGPMAQVWILRRDMGPMDAKRVGLDDAVCGDCALRGEGGYNSACYVSPWQAPNQVYKAFRAGHYPALDHHAVRATMTGRHVRLSAYGDPAAVPTPVWVNLLTTVSGWIGYSHQWAKADPALRWLLMASVDDVHDGLVAQRAGWRTFRARNAGDPRVTWNSGLNRGLEVICPASDEAGHRVTCEQCQLCRGRSRPARSITIIAHGKPGQAAAFYRNQGELARRREAV